MSFNGSAVFIDEGFNVKVVILQIVILNFKIFLREIKGLLHQVVVGIIHLLFCLIKMREDIFYKCNRITFSKVNFFGQFNTSLFWCSALSFVADPDNFGGEGAE